MIAWLEKLFLAVFRSGGLGYLVGICEDWRGMSVERKLRVN